MNRPDPKPQLTEQSLDKKGEVDPFDLVASGSTNPSPNSTSSVRRGLGPCEAIIKISSTGVFLQCLRCGIVAPLHHIQREG